MIEVRFLVGAYGIVQAVEVSIFTNYISRMEKGKQIGVVTHWYDKLSVAVVKLTGTLKKGDTVMVKKGEEEFEETITSLQLDHKDADSAKKGDDAAVKLSRRAKEGSAVFLLK